MNRSCLIACVPSRGQTQVSLTLATSCWLSPTPEDPGWVRGDPWVGDGQREANKNCDPVLGLSNRYTDPPGVKRTRKLSSLP